MGTKDAQSTEKEIADRLKMFFEAMGQWEANCKASYRKVRKGEMDHEKMKSDSLESLKEIFREHCTTWDKPVRAQYSIHFSLIPTYGSDLEDILSIEVVGQRAKVMTQQLVATKNKLVYRLSHDGRQWRIEDSRKRLEGDQEFDWDL